MRFTEASINSFVDKSTRFDAIGLRRFGESRTTLLLIKIKLLIMSTFKQARP